MKTCNRFVCFFLLPFRAENPVQEHKQKQIKIMSRNHRAAASAEVNEEEEEENNPKRAKSTDVDVILNKTFFVDHLQCVVCIGTLRAPILAVPCAHQFCETCLASWFHKQKNNTCPICRAKVYMVINAPKVTERLLEVYAERFPPQSSSSNSAVAESSQESTDNEKTKLPVLIKNEPLRRNHRNIFVNATDDDEEDNSEESDDSDSDDDGQAFAQAVAYPVPMEQILAFMELTGASEVIAQQTIAGALARGLSMDHAVEYFFSQAAA